MTNQRENTTLKKHQARRGVYVPADNREQLFIYLRAAGYTLKETARLLRYSLREAFDLHPQVNEQIAIEAAYIETLKIDKWQKEQKERQKQPL